MGSRRHERELADARSRYVGALARLARADEQVRQVDVPFDPGRGIEPTPWTREHVQAVLAICQAWQDVVDSRRSWDRMRREWRSSH